MEEIIQALVAEKARLQREIERLDKMIALAGGSPSEAAPRVIRPKQSRNRPRKGGGRGHLKEAIVAEIQAAGPKGIAVKEIAARVGVAPSRLGPWFAATGKRIKEIKRMNRGVYAWQDGSAREEKQS